MRSIIAALCLLLLLPGCDPNKKLTKLLAKHPELRDTVYIHDTIEAIVEYVRGDTVFRDVPGDTVTYWKDRVRVTYVRMPGDTIYLRGECLPDTIRQVITREIPVIQPTKVVEKIPWWMIAVIIGALTLSVIAMLRR